jgi:hypothetical protein
MNGLIVNAELAMMQSWTFGVDLMMKKVWFNVSDGENHYKDFKWLMWGDDDGCFFFDRSYDSLGWAVRRAKKLIEDGKATKACVLKPHNGSYYSVMWGIF